MDFKLTSSAFKHDGFIPSKYTCDGDNISPDLKWNNVPDGTKTFAIIVDDPDAPGGVFVHWVVYNISSSITSLPENVTSKNLPKGALQIINHFNEYDYGGPCPPTGVHRYYFKIYALDTELNLKEGAGKRDLLQAIEGHILAESELVGKYRRNI